ncbi:hypothetical protein SAMN05216282_11156 [Cryobacterium psychrotolerans]|uniref:Uncharacterized protein n=1 Tax=Cryobacterium psychrotolerans TaxID=386301 RepID=A0A1G9E730_9MICO|nr:hypothetical protein [Cryobacterium psychrotolerans]TFD86397.1 hypothetical protein E3T56_07385 [Cryobacterium psychrotolerans]SDK71942.1 hypothetical protein SAMN05216282_11156 [Cryobacterium psychrotolerans]
MSAELHPHTARQTLGTAYNLRPSTVGVRAGDLRPGHVVVESDDHPAVIVRITLLRSGCVRIYARYIWSAATEPDWELGYFHPDTRIPTAEDGEY